MKFYLYQFKLLVMFIIITLIFNSCAEEEDALSPYVGGPKLSSIKVEDESFTPKVSWIGGYVAVFGVNKGDKAILDSTLVWLIHSSTNSISYPLKYGFVPTGAEDIASQFGGLSKDSLDEDQKYTFWVLKEDVWDQVSANPNKELFVLDSAVNSVTITGDSLFITAESFTTANKSLNVYINIVNPRPLGVLATLTVESTKLNVPLIKWVIKDPSVTDTLVAAIGLYKGLNYDAANALWEVYSFRDSSGIIIYVRDNVIASPILVGDSVSNTKTFVEFKKENFERNQDYTIWIADKTWDRVNRQRFTKGYAYITFRVE
jgi:hypothetical protein